MCKYRLLFQPDFVKLPAVAFLLSAGGAGVPPTHRSVFCKWYFPGSLIICLTLLQDRLRGAQKFAKCVSGAGL